MGLAFRDLHRVETDLAREFRRVAHRHAAQADVFRLCVHFADQCDRHAAALVEAAGRYGEKLRAEPAGSAPAGPARRRAVRPVDQGPILLAHLRALSTLAHDSEIAWTVIGQGARAQHDDELTALVYACGRETAVQGQWLRTRLEEAAPQVLSGFGSERPNRAGPVDGEHDRVHGSRGGDEQAVALQPAEHEVRGCLR
jgi:hypothetical protein